MPCPAPHDLLLLVWEGLTVAGLAIGAALGLRTTGAILDNVGLVNGLVVVTLWFSTVSDISCVSLAVVEHVPS